MKKHLMLIQITLALYPHPWKLAKIIALYKKKNRLLPENYRSISLLNCFEKHFEKLVYIQMMNFIDKHKVLFIYQYGFRRKHSTSLALIDLVDEIKFAIDNNEYALGILLDITKAFDSINHDIPLSKLEHYGFRGHFPACRTSLIATRFWVVMICPIIKCLTVLEFSFILFDLCLFITIFNFILNYVPIVTFWILTYHKIWILFCFIWSYWIIYFLTCLEVFWSVVS